MSFFRPEDSEYEVACMKPGVGKLEVFPSIWGRKYISVDVLTIISQSFPLTSSQTGPEALETAKRMLHG
jgi:hypothetical protein